MEFMDIAREYGLFVTSVVFIIWDSRQRESRYIGIIDELSTRYGIIDKRLERIEDRLGR